MFKRLTLICLCVLAVATFARAQEATPEPGSRPFEREIYTVLRYGDDVFEPNAWFASAEETSTRTRATWRSDVLGGLAYADYLHFDAGISTEGLESIFTTEWFTATLSNYSVWREESRCSLGNLRLYEFTLRTNDIDYVMHYWVEWVTDTRVMALFVVFPTSDETSLPTYSERLFPELATCSGAVG